MAQSLSNIKKKARGSKNYFLLCLFIAIAAWFIMKLSKNYQVSYTYQVTLKNVPKEKVVVYQSDSTFIVNMENKGLSLLGADLRPKKIQLDYEILLTDYQKQRKSVHIQNNQLVEYLKREKRFSNNLKTVNINAISFRFDDVSNEE